MSTHDRRGPAARPAGQPGIGSPTGNEPLPAGGTTTPTGSTTVNRDRQSSPGQQGQQDTGRSTTDTVKHAAGSAAHQATEQGKSQLAGQKTQAASQLSTVADAVRATGEQLRKQDQGSLAQYAEMGASQIDRFADFLHNKDINELIGEAERYARREPTLFLAGAFALGVVASRFLKSSQRHSDGPQSWNGSGSQGWSGAGSQGWTGPEQTGTGQHYSTPQHYPTPTTTTTGTAGSPTYGTSTEPSGPGLPSRPGTVRS